MLIYVLLILLLVIVIVVVFNYSRHEGMAVVAEEHADWKYTKIPKVAFTYWAGPMSYLHLLCLKSFKYFNPSWKVILYQPVQEYKGKNTWWEGKHRVKYTASDHRQYIRDLGIEIVDIDLEAIGFRNDVPEVFKSNYVTYYVLSRDGGVWFDMDILFIKGMHELEMTDYIGGNASDIEAVVSYCPRWWILPGYFSTGFLMGAPGSKFFKYLFDFLLVNFKPWKYQSATNDLYPKLFRNLEGIVKKFPDLHFANLDMDVIYPYRYTDIDIIFNQNDTSRIKNNTIGIHWYNADSVTRQFLNEDDYEKDVTINTVIKQYLPRDILY